MTAPAAWRHRWARGDTRCTVPDARDPYDICGCTTPEPDPASPCGYVYKTPAIACGGRGAHAIVGHPHQPTRCARCGHGVEPVR